MNIKGKLDNPMVTNFISLVLLQGVNYLLPLISFPFLFRILGVERYGLVTFGYALMQYFVMFTDFGFNLSATKYISQHRQDAQAINTFLNSAMIGRFILCVISFTILVLLISTFEKFRSESMLYMLYFGIIIGNVMFPMWFFQGMENMKYITIFNIVAKSLSFIPFFIFIRGPEDYLFVPICYSVGFILAGLVSIFIVYYKMGMRWYIPSILHIKNALKDSSTYFLSRASTSLFTTSNSFILGLVCGNTAVGYYSAAEKLYQAYNQLLSPFTGVLFPHIAKSRDVAFFKKVFYRIATINIFSVSLVLLIASYVLQIVYDTADSNILHIFRTLICACFVTMPSMLMGYPFLAAMGHPLFTNWTVICTSVLHITGLFLLFLLHILTPVSVAMMVVCSEALLFCFRIWGIRRFQLFKG
ncbi:MAG: oligosaccharide flippase family protein [Parabacteroides sp.]|nr:oligosaccharide flippase family protein [Parabacteroides sp.]MCI7783221.1 oligosaccharide flippase family protein [Parabacteroides sp.]MDY4756560.1 oligosaccharide flippase family protein [Parabacteroides sp.]